MPAKRKTSSKGSTIPFLGVFTAVGALLVLVISVAGIFQNTEYRSQAEGDVLWSADLEQAGMSGLSSWIDGGGAARTVLGTSIIVSPDVAKNGAYSAKFETTVNGSPDATTQLERFVEASQHNDLYYSFWLYIPSVISTAGNNWTWQVMQFRFGDTGTPGASALSLMIKTLETGQMSFYVQNWLTSSSTQQSVATLPAGEWVHVEAFLKQSAGTDGQLTIWQNGQKLFDLTNIQTRVEGTTQKWIISNDTIGASREATVLYIDDAVISTSYRGPNASLPLATVTPTLSIGDPTATPIDGIISDITCTLSADAKVYAWITEPYVRFAVVSKGVADGKGLEITSIQDTRVPPAFGAPQHVQILNESPPYDEEVDIVDPGISELHTIGGRWNSTAQEEYTLTFLAAYDPSVTEHRLFVGVNHEPYSTRVSVPCDLDSAWNAQDPESSITPSATPTPTTDILPPRPFWWEYLPEPLRNFLELLYITVVYFGQYSNLSHLLDGIF